MGHQGWLWLHNSFCCYKNPLKTTFRNWPLAGCRKTMQWMQHKSTRQDQLKCSLRTQKAQRLIKNLLDITHYCWRWKQFDICVHPFMQSEGGMWIHIVTSGFPWNTSESSSPPPAEALTRNQRKETKKEESMDTFSKDVWKLCIFLL